jgi:crotonobetainyl-CoA:carnitine CoA-transferase CaiB-like acyl-CoA transferase
MDRIEQPIGSFFLKHTKARLEAEAVKRDIVLFLVCTTEDELACPQLDERNYWVDTDHPELGDTIRYPGPWIKLSHHGWKMRYRAPLIGEHNEDIYCGEMGLSKKELTMLCSAGVI